MTLGSYDDRHSFFSPFPFLRFPSFWRRNSEAWKDENEIRVYSHSNIIYWWPVWAYSAFCWLATYVHHDQINPGGLKPVNVFPSPWLGISFLCVFFFVVTLSNVKLRGFYALLVIMAIALLIIGVHAVIGLDRIFGALHLLFVYMNEAFYAVTAVFMCGLWCGVVFGVDRMSYYRFTPGQVIEEHRFGQLPGVNLPTDGMTVRRMATDFFRHQILGLSFLGFGTGDFICKPSTVSGHEPLVLENVIQLSRKFPRIETMIQKG